MLIVFGLIAFDQALAVIDIFPHHFKSSSGFFTPMQLVEALLFQPDETDQDRIRGVHNAVLRLKRKSRSFFLASATFQGRLRIDLVLL
jgi:15-cis-phytoene synthase / lycopene beta-cyclase